MSAKFPRRFGKYLLLKSLAKGGMGEIYVASVGDVGGFEKLCVIKKVLTEKADPAKAKRFLDEAKVVLRLSHSALVATFDAGEVDNEFYIAMELVEGKDLREVWNRCVRTKQRIPLDVALQVAREMARALAYVHGYEDLKLVHRDVAPPNILLAYVGDVKLTDFGLARSVLKQEHTSPGVVFGRAAYLAPEQARGEVADPRTDVYTLGIVLWELLTGQQYLHLTGLDPAAALAIVRHPKQVAPSQRAPWITGSLDRLVMKALSPDRNQRFASADEMRQALTETIAEVAPRADGARITEFLKAIYADAIEQERAERERFLKEVIPQFSAGVTAAEPPKVEAPAPEKPAAAPETAVAPPPPPRRPTSIPPPPPPGPPARSKLAPLPGVAPALPSGKRTPAVGTPARSEASRASGTDLASILMRERRLEAGRAIQIAFQIGRALAPAHAGGAADGALAPARLVVDDANDDQVTLLPAPAKKPRTYLAPEQAKGAPADARSDVYAIGAILYEMVTGAPPHVGTSSNGRSSGGLPQSPRMFRPEIPVELERLVLATLDPDPQKRPATLAALEDALRTVENAPGASVGRIGPAASSQAIERRQVRRQAALRVLDELSTVSPSPSRSDPPAADEPSFVPVPVPPEPEEPPAPRVRRGFMLVVAAGVGVVLIVLALL